MTPEEKKCSKCKEIKSIDNFSKREYGSKDGYYSQCKCCINKRNSEYQKNNREKYKMAMDKYRKNNIDKVKESQIKQAEKRRRLNIKSVSSGFVNDKEKICTKCKTLKSISEFSKDKKYIDGLDSQCKNCKRLSSKKWALQNRDKINKKTKEWFLKNPKKKREIYDKGNKRKRETIVTILNKHYNKNTCPDELKPVVAAAIAVKKLNKTIKKIGETK